MLLRQTENKNVLFLMVVFYVQNLFSLQMCENNSKSSNFQVASLSNQPKDLLVSKLQAPQVWLHLQFSCVWRMFWETATEHKTIGWNKTHSFIHETPRSRSFGFSHPRTEDQRPKTGCMISAAAGLQQVNRHPTELKQPSSWKRHTDIFFYAQSASFLYNLNH